MTTMAVETVCLTKQFRDFWQRQRITAVRDLNLRIPRGTIFALLGPNGSGKTTTLKLLTGLLHPSAGSIRILDGRPRDRSTRRHLGYLPENTGMYPYLSAREMLRFHAGLFGIEGNTAGNRCNTLLETVDLARAADRPVGNFSQGMKKRLGLALALVNEPELLILDEPTAGLDPAGCKRVKDLLRRQAAAGKTVIISSHLLADIEDVCEAVCILHDGRQIAGGPLDELVVQREQTRFTANGIDDESLTALQETFRRVTGRPAMIDHPRIRLESLFEQAVTDAAASQTDIP